MKIAFVVDDDLAYQKFMQMHLRRFGYEVRSFVDGKECLLQLTESPSLIILDQNLEEEKTGLDYLREIRKSAPNIPVLFLSAQNDLSAAVEAVKLGAVDFIEKNSAAYIRLRTALENLEKPVAKSKIPINLENYQWFIFGILTVLAVIAVSLWIRILI